MALYSLSFLFLPGTIIHEVSHFILATLLKVPTGELSVLPKVEKSGEVKAGKLEIGNVDPFRRTLVGISPLISGLIIIYLVGHYLLPNNFSWASINPLLLFITGYLLFVVTTTMFSSKKDLESLIIAGPITLLIFIAFYFLGVRVFFSEALSEKIGLVFGNLNFYLGFASGVNLIIFTLLHLKLIFWQKILKRKIQSF